MEKNGHFVGGTWKLEYLENENGHGKVIECEQIMGATYPQLYPDVWAEMGGRWVCFQPNIEQPGFPILGVLRGTAGPYGCMEAFLPTMGVFSVVPDPTSMGVFPGGATPV